MKPTVISSANSGSGNLQTGGNGVTIPITREHRNQQQQQPHFHTQAQDFVDGEMQGTSYGSPGSFGRSQRQQQPQQQQENPLNFQQDFDFEPDVGMDMFPRTRLGRMTHDNFGDFGGTARKRNSLHDPQFHNDGFSRYFDDGADFGFPQFNSLGRRRINTRNDDFFNRLPSEFRQYIPESFAHRRGGAGMTGMTGSPGGVPQQSTQQEHQTNFYNTMPQPSSRKVCDAAIQTENPTGSCEVDHATNSESLYQHGLRNTMDMGIKSPSENENQSPRSSSAPPTEQPNLHQPIHSQQQQIPITSSSRHTPPPQQQQPFATQTSPQIQSVGHGAQSPQFKKLFYGSQQQAHPQQKQQTPPPQTPGGSYIRTIPIFVEGRTDPIINNKEIPNQNVTPNFLPASGNVRSFTPPKQQTPRPTPLNTQQQPTPSSGNVPPQTPHTVDTINKIQNIQRDVLDLMSRVENFMGTRADKEYVYLDEMLTRNLLKLDNIDTNGKESIRLARKEAIKCIQASINVLEAKAEENKRAAQCGSEANDVSVEDEQAQNEVPFLPQKPPSTEVFTKESITTTTGDKIEEPTDIQVSEPIPLPPPESEKFNEVKIEDCPEDDPHSTCNKEESVPKFEKTLKKSKAK